MVAEGVTVEPRTGAVHAHSLVRALRAVPSLSPCDDDVLLAIVGDSVNLVWPAGSTIFAPGDEPEGLFIVLSGRVRVLRNDEELATLGTGEYFGELSMLLGTPHQHTVVAAEDAELMVVPKERFDSLLAENHGLAEGIRRKAEERLAANRGEAPTD